jgi:23S rRNA pseudouridine2604 synthase
MSWGLLILGSYTKKTKIERVSSWTFKIILTEWKNRQIRRMVESVWGKVKKLKRIRIENIELWKLQPWEYKHLTEKEKSVLFTKLGIQ